MIHLKQIVKTYTVNQSEVYALDNVSLFIPAGEIFGVIGESGAGKSTLLRTINLLERPTSGKVIVDGIELTHLKPSELKMKRHQIGMIFQHFNLLQSRTVFENIALPLELLHVKPEVIQKRVNELLNLVRLTEHKHHYPEQLSGGQKQRVAIARALATKPSILLCDEPTSALDVNSTAQVLELLKEINAKFGVTIVIITHELEVIKQICHRAGVMHGGKLIEVASLLDLFARPKTLISKTLVQRALHNELPSVINEQLHGERKVHDSIVIRLTFIGKDSNNPLITQLVQRFNIVVNIIQANIENIQNETFGFTVCQLSGDALAIDEALIFLAASTVSAEVLGYV